jgi:hypothetical protein
VTVHLYNMARSSRWHTLLINFLLVSFEAGRCSLGCPHLSWRLVHSLHKSGGMSPHAGHRLASQEPATDTAVTDACLTELLCCLVARGGKMA